MNANGLVYHIPGSETTSSVGLFTWPTGIPGFLAVLGLLLAVSLVLGLTIWYTVRAVKAVFNWSSATITRSRKLKPLLLPMYVADQGHQANRDVFEVSFPLSTLTAVVSYQDNDIVAPRLTDVEPTRERTQGSAPC